MKNKIIKCLISVGIIVLCIVTSNIIKDTSNRMVKDFDVSLSISYRTVIGSVICLIIGLAIGYIIRTLAIIETQHVLFIVVMGITIACMVCMILMGVDWLFVNTFSTGFGDFVSKTLGVNVAVFIMEYGRFFFILLGLLDMLFWPLKKENALYNRPTQSESV
ncbi:MAG: hypothetical protein E7241_07790 [Lachnospiraceae bacterium]|nr:hypothetical protein [Lachnospiraceae bacterium]